MINTINTTKPSQKIRTICVAGPDCAKFLQGQLTCDVLALLNDEVTLGAYCNIKGKVESLFYLEYSDSNYYLHLPPDLLESTLRELKKYGAFSKITIEEVDHHIPNIANLSDEEAILAGIPQIYAATVGEFFPHDLNLPNLNAVSFKKGCYRGQEIVARMQHRGKLKRSLYVFNSTENNVKPGSKIDANDLNAGTVVRCCKTKDGNVLGLAVLTDSLIAEQLKIDHHLIQIAQ